MTYIDQQKARRGAYTGVTAYDREHTYPGYVLFSPLYGNKTYLMELDGTVVHQWTHKYAPGSYGRLTLEGNLLYGGKVEGEGADVFPMWPLFKGGIIQEIDWEGNVLWEHRDSLHHHDARKTPNGGVMYVSMERMPEDLARQVQGGLEMPGDFGLWADVIVELDARGNTIWKWHAYEHMDVESDRIPPNVPRWSWTHVNTVVPLENDQVLVSMRNTSTVGLIDKQSGEFIWKIGDEILGGQHDPSLLPNGNILIFDNGIYRRFDPFIYSRVIEIAPESGEIVWEYRDAPVWEFFSATISGAQRLPNGNTLITEGDRGRMFQVTPDQQVVWEYTNPYFNANTENVEVNSVFRGLHYAADELPNLR